MYTEGHRLEKKRIFQILKKNNKIFIMNVLITKKYLIS